MAALTALRHQCRRPARHTAGVPETPRPAAVPDSLDAPGADHVVERAGAGDIDGIAGALAAAFSGYACSRRGQASRLLRPVVDVARELGTPAYLATSSLGNVALYERNGFEVIGEAAVPGRGTRVWAMRT